MFFLSHFCSFFFTSCTTSSPYNRGSLSDAMDKAEDDHEGSRRVPNDRDEPSRGRDSRDDDRYTQDTTSPQDEAVYYSDPFVGEVYLLFRGGNSWGGAPYFNSLFDGEVLIGGREDSLEVLLFAGIKAVIAKESSEIYDSVDDGVLILRAGIEGRYYPFPDLQFMSPYLLAQAGGIYMYWSFKNPLEAGGDLITSDSVGGMMLGVGAGVNLIDKGGFRAGVSCIPETHFFYSETQQGFQNDVFDLYGNIRWAVDVGLRM